MAGKITFRHGVHPSRVGGWEQPVKLTDAQLASLGNFVVPELLGGGKTVMVGNLIRDQFLKARDWPFGSVLALSVIVFLVGLFLVQAWATRRVSGGQSDA